MATFDDKIAYAKNNYFYCSAVVFYDIFERKKDGIIIFVPYFADTIMAMKKIVLAQEIGCSANIVAWHKSHSMPVNNNN